MRVQPVGPHGDGFAGQHAQGESCKHQTTKSVRHPRGLLEALTPQEGVQLDARGAKVEPVEGGKVDQAVEGHGLLVPFVSVVRIGADFVGELAGIVAGRFWFRRLGFRNSWSHVLKHREYL